MFTGHRDHEKIILATFFTLSKNEYKSPKCRFTGKTFRMIIWGLWPTRGAKNPKPRLNMVPGSIKRHVPSNGASPTCLLCQNNQEIQGTVTEVEKRTHCTWVPGNMLEMSFNSFLSSPNNFFLEKDLRAKKWVVSTCLLDKGIMKINLATKFTLYKNDYKSPKCRFPGKTLGMIIWGFCDLPGGQKNPNHDKIWSPAA